jgi:hypothetical protein
VNDQLIVIEPLIWPAALQSVGSFGSSTAGPGQSK